jgi:hypothetical protein
MDKHDQLMDLRLRKPFVPFRISLSDGRTLELTRQLGFAVGGRLILVAQDNGAALRIKIDQIVSIDVLEPIS